jgi:methionine-rich copper-binding protein CopC
MKFMQKLFLAFGFFTACATLAHAHAFLDHADPKVGSTVNGSPSVVKVWFTMEIQGVLSKIEVFDVKGHEVDEKDARVDPADKSLMVVSVPKLPAGAYKVVWNAVCLCCGHHTTGAFTFEVAAPKNPHYSLNKR